MRNVTITMDEALIRLTEAEAAKAGKSLSDFVSDLVAMAISAGETPKKNPQQEAIRRFLSGPKWDVTTDGKMPTAEERNA